MASEAPRILLVEDDATHALLMKARLSELGVQIEEATTRTAAQQALSERSFELVILDMPLPDGTGLEIQDWLARQGEVPLILFVTSDDLVEQAVKAVRSGAGDYVVKRPNYLERMFEAVVELLDSLTTSPPAELKGRSEFEQRERADLLQALEEHRWNVSATARALGMSRGKLRGRMRALDLE